MGLVSSPHTCYPRHNSFPSGSSGAKASAGVLLLIPLCPDPPRLPCLTAGASVLLCKDAHKLTEPVRQPLPKWAASSLHFFPHPCPAPFLAPSLDCRPLPFSEEGGLKTGSQGNPQKPRSHGGLTSSTPRWGLPSGGSG